MANSMASINFQMGSQDHYNNQQLTHASGITTNKSKQTNESIKVCIRVRPLLQNELHKDEIVYYPEGNDPSLQVSLFTQLMVCRGSALLTDSTSLSPNSIGFLISTLIRMKCSILLEVSFMLRFLIFNLKAILMMFSKVIIRPFLLTDKLAQERLSPCLVLTGMTTWATRIPWATSPVPVLTPSTNQVEIHFY